MTVCLKWKDRLLDIALGWAASSELQEHLSACAGCSRALVEMRASRERMDGAVEKLVRDAEPSPAFRARLLASIAARPAASKKWPVLVGAAAAAAFAAVLLVPRVKEVASPPSDIASVSALTQWRSPTESLLRAPAGEILKSTPKSRKKGNRR